MSRKWERGRLAVVGLLLLAPAARGQGDPAWREPTDAAEAPANEDEDRLDVAALRSQLPGVELAPALPAVRVFPFLGGVIPYQIMGLGLMVELVPVPWLPANAEYSFRFPRLARKPSRSTQYTRSPFLGVAPFFRREPSEIGGSKNPRFKGPCKSHSWEKAPPAPKE